jgi:hypothetical protein
MNVSALGAGLAPLRGRQFYLTALGAGLQIDVWCSRGLSPLPSAMLAGPNIIRDGAEIPMLVVLHNYPHSADLFLMPILCLSK